MLEERRLGTFDVYEHEEHCFEKVVLFTIIRRTTENIELTLHTCFQCSSQFYYYEHFFMEGTL